MMTPRDEIKGENKMNKSKAAIAASRFVSIIQMISGVFFLVIFGLCTIAYAVDPEYRSDVGIDFLIFLIVFDLIGIILIYFSRKRKKLIEEFKEYVLHISSDPSGSISSLAASMGKTKNEVKRNLEMMIKRNYFVNAHINHEKDRLVIGSSAAAVQQQQILQGELVPVKCKCCGGANQVIPGKIMTCEYCGAPIKA